MNDQKTFQTDVRDNMVAFTLVAWVTELQYISLWQHWILSLCFWHDQKSFPCLYPCLPNANPSAVCICFRWISSTGRGFRQTKSSCFSRTLIYHTVIPLISAASNISILKKWFIPPVQRGEDVLPCPRNWLSLPVSVSPSPHPSPVSETENNTACK